FLAGQRNRARAGLLCLRGARAIGVQDRGRPPGGGGVQRGVWRVPPPVRSRPDGGVARGGTHGVPEAYVRERGRPRRMAARRARTSPNRDGSMTDDRLEEREKERHL